MWDFHPPKEGRTLDSRIKSPLALRPALGALRRTCGKGQMALYEVESCGLARVASDDRIVRGRGACGKGFELAEPVPPGVPGSCQSEALRG